MSFSWRTNPEVRTFFALSHLASRLTPLFGELATGLHVHQRDTSLICSLFTAARAWTKSFAPYFRVFAAVDPSLCMCLKRYCSLLNVFGWAFEFAWCTSRLLLSNTVERARSAAISPNSWCKKLFVDTKLSLVGGGQADFGRFGKLLCAFYVRKSRSVSWPLFSISQTPIFDTLWDVWASPSYFRCGWRQCAEKFFPGSFERIPTAITAPWTKLHVRSTAPWTRTRNSEKATFLLPVCTRKTYSIQHSLDPSRSRRGSA